jgi:hypothetical protein
MPREMLVVRANLHIARAFPEQVHCKSYLYSAFGEMMFYAILAVLQALCGCVTAVNVKAFVPHRLNIS